MRNRPPPRRNRHHRRPVRDAPGTPPSPKTQPGTRRVPPGTRGPPKGDPHRTSTSASFRQAADPDGRRARHRPVRVAPRTAGRREPSGRRPPGRRMAAGEHLPPHRGEPPHEPPPRPRGSPRHAGDLFRRPARPPRPAQESVRAPRRPLRRRHVAQCVREGGHRLARGEPGPRHARRRRRARGPGGPPRVLHRRPLRAVGRSHRGGPRAVRHPPRTGPTPSGTTRCRAATTRIPARTGDRTRCIRLVGPLARPRRRPGAPPRHHRFRPRPSPRRPGR
ncbi:hypothetical protein SUDANB6_05203 [Streptomyces sp. enrichment culture]